MCLLKRKLWNRNGFLLVEAVAAMIVLAVGLVAVMRSLVIQRQAVTYNMDVTRALFVLQSRMGALYAGINSDGLEGPVCNIQKSVTDILRQMKGIERVVLSAKVGESSIRWLAVTGYVRKEAERRR